MRLKDELYTSSHGIDGLILDMPAKDPKREKETKVGNMVRCGAGELIYLFRGYIEHLYNRSTIIRIENAMECDKRLAKSKESLAVVRLVNMEVIDNGI